MISVSPAAAAAVAETIAAHDANDVATAELADVVPPRLCCFRLAPVMVVWIVMSCHEAMLRSTLIDDILFVACSGVHARTRVHASSSCIGFHI